VTRQPVDHLVRDRAAEEITTSIALTAGAGAGKTSVLVRRITALLRAGVDPTRVAAITFTEKAAAEISHRVRLAIESANDAEVPAEAVSLLNISTLHAFAHSLLTAEPLEAGWAPGTELSYEASVSAEVDAWWTGFRRRNPLAAERAHEHCSPGQRNALATLLIDNRDLRARVSPPRTDDELLAELRAVRANIETEAALCRSDNCKLLRGNDAFRAEFTRWVSLPPPEAVREAMASDAKPKKAGGKAADWPDGKAPFKEALDGFGRWKAQVGASIHGTLVRELLEHVVPTALRNRREGALATQQDLLFRAAALLREYEPVRLRLAERFDALLIDEVQDTDPLQAEVAMLLAREPGAPGTWTESAPRPGALFAVGDPQQSIYRFRRADVATWAQLSAAVAQQGESLVLSQNFRSVPGILSWVREVFGDGTHPQVPWREPAELDPVVVVHSSTDDEIEDAVAWVHRLKGEGRVVDRETDQLRPVEDRDFLFLVPRWKNADALAARLEAAGLRADVDGGRTFFGRDEVRLSLALLSCMVEPGDTQSTALVLRGLFGVTPADLAAHVAADGGLRLTLPDPPPGPVGDALRVLASVRRESRGSLVDLLDRGLEAAGAAPAWVLRADAGSRFANVDKFRKIVLDEERDGGTRLAVLERLGRMAWDASEDEMSLTEPAQRAARVTTIFKAKGLEAPIVVLLDLVKRVSAGDRIVLRDEGEVLLSASKLLKPPGWQAAATAEKEQVLQEIRRLAYVAATRARDQLVVLSVPRATISKVYEPAIPQGSDEEESVAVGDAVVLSVPGSSLPRAPQQAAVFPGWDERVDRALEDGGESDEVESGREAELTRRVRSAKRAGVRWETVTSRAARRGGRGRPLEGSGLGPEAVRLGEAMHRVLELLDLSTSREAQKTEARRLTPALVRLLAIRDPEGEEKVLGAILRILDHPMLDLARGAQRRLQEVPFITRDGTTRVTGTIDLAFPLDEAETRWQVVDWKIHVPSSGRGRTQYEAQLQLYAKAVLAGVSPCEAVDTLLVGPHQELPPAPPADDALDLVLDAMRPLLEAILAGGASAPEVGVDISEEIEGELVWEEARVSVLDGPAEEVDGWTVFGSDATAAEVLAALGVEVANE